MKTIPPPCPEPEVGPKYWRSLEHAAETPEFRQWMEKEFPAGASELTDPVTRRHFVKIMSASFVLAGIGLSGCRRPVEKILPFSKMPEGYTHGLSRFYATSMPSRGSALPLVVRSHEGRPLKIEGNPEHPDSNGGTDGFAQASILNLYDPDRAQHHTEFRNRASGNTVSREKVIDFLDSLSKKFSANQGAGFSFLVERSSSPSRLRLQQLIAQRFPQAQWVVYEPVDLSSGAKWISQALGQSVTPVYRLDEAKAILTLDADILGSEENSLQNIRGFAKGRRLEKPTDSMNRLYTVESTLSITGMSADHRLRLASSHVGRLAQAILKALDGGSISEADLGFADTNKDVNLVEWATACARDLQEKGSAAVVIAGYRQPQAVHDLALAINQKLKSLGTVVTFYKAPATKEQTIQELGQSLTGGSVDTLVILGGNPVYNAPGELNWEKAQKQAKTIVRLGYYEDETFAACDWHIAQAHYLESWGDARTANGSLVPVQPLIEPLFGGMTELEVLARIAGAERTSPYEIARDTFAELSGARDEDSWQRYLHDGFLPKSSPEAVNAASLNVRAPGALPEAATLGKDALEVVFTRDYSVDDGRYNNNGWLQECPDPVTKITWDNAVLLSRLTAKELGFKPGDVVTINVGGRSVTGPVWVQPGQANYVVGLALGYGRKRSGRVGAFDGKSVGFDAYPLRDAANAGFLSQAKLTKTGGNFQFACTQDHWSMEGRPIIREANLEQWRQKPDFAKNMDLEAHAPNAGPLYRHPYSSNPALKSDVHQWGMAIDLTSCVGCNACVIACQSENNVPIVGKEQVSKGREMHWLRIDRYFAGDPKKQALGATHGDEAQADEDWIDNCQTVNQPMMCQHCESAPCESVCPVNATVHDEEGLNLMAYNRCVGTRYCSNNCAWKVRRFNFFDYNKRPLENLYAGPLAKREQEEYDLIKLVKNPDVSVRMRGVMEKCTFCLQRIEGAKISQKVKAGPTGNVQVPDGDIKTACQQACPAESIVFGNLLDENSRVSKLKESLRNYAVLGFLDTKPRLTYLARIRNPNKAMPDFRESPLSLEEYTSKNEHSEKNHGHDAPAKGAAAPAKGAH